MAVYGNAEGNLTNWAGYFAEGNVYIKNNLISGPIQTSKYGAIQYSTGIELTNPDVATAGTQPWSPAIKFSQNAYDNSIGSSVYLNWYLQTEGFVTPGGGSVFEIMSKRAIDSFIPFAIDEFGRIYMGETFTGQNFGQWKIILNGKTCVGFPEDGGVANLEINGGTVIGYYTNGYAGHSLSPGYGAIIEGNVIIGATSWGGGQKLYVNGTAYTGAFTTTGVLTLPNSNTLTGTSGVVTFNGAIQATGLRVTNPDGAPAIIVKGVSSNTRHSSTTEATTTSYPTPVLLKSVTFTNGLLGQQRFLFDIKTGGGPSAYAQIYKNATPVGTLQSNGTTSYVTKSEDLDIDWAPGDVCGLYGYNNGGTCYVRNFYIQYDDAPVVEVAATLYTKP
jgi:hypothetical protein